MSEMDELRRDIGDLKSRVSNVPLRTAGGGTGETVARVPVLPAVPTSGTRRVFWYSNATLAGGEGDDQIWQCSFPQTIWYPMDKPTIKVGTPP